MVAPAESALSPGVTPSLCQYADELAAAGVQVVGRTGTEFWVRYEGLALMRVPNLVSNAPAVVDVADLLSASRTLVATYLVEPDERHPANAWIYLCDDPGYSLNRLAPPVRRNVTRGLRELRIEPVSAATVLEHAFQAYSDTRRRVGVSDGNREAFTRRFERCAENGGHTFIGAWHADVLAAFLSITAVDDWVEIEGCFSTDASLPSRPNDTLLVTALADFLVRRRVRVVSYGLSSIQTVSNAPGLHEFKRKLGFRAVPVHRAFMPHPLLRPFVNGISHACIQGALWVDPHNRVLKKADGMFAAMRGRRPLVEF